MFLSNIDKMVVSCLLQTSEDAELLWRLARASRDLAQLGGTSAAEKKALVYEALGYAQRALEKDHASSAAHKVRPCGHGGCLVLRARCLLACPLYIERDSRAFLPCGAPPPRVRGAASGCALWAPWEPFHASLDLSSQECKHLTGFPFPHAPFPSGPLLTRTPPALPPARPSRGPVTLGTGRCLDEDVTRSHQVSQWSRRP